MLLNPTATLLLLFFAGLVGGGMRAFITKAQATVSARSAVDVVMGACFGVFVPRLADKVFPLWGALSPLEQFLGVVITTYFFGDVLQNLVLSRVQFFLDKLGPAPITPPAPAVEPAPPTPGGKRLLGVAIALGLVLGACGGGQVQAPAPGDALSVMKEPDYVKVPLQPARNLWATIRQTARGRIVYVQGKIARGELTAAESAQVLKDIETARQLDFEIARALDNPKAELDVQKIAKILEVTAKIVGALTP